MSDSRRRLHRTMTLLAAMGIAAAVAGCGRTLVFVERDGINFAIRANASSSPPLELNFGLDRVIATIVPPVGESGGQPNGDAVNMFAGFQVAANTDPAKPLAPDVKIDTQFASGAAAKSVAESPPVVAGLVVASIVSPNSGIQRGPDFLVTFADRRQLLAAIRDLSDDQAVSVARSMLPNLSSRGADIQTQLAPFVAFLSRGGKLTPTIAREILNTWAPTESVTPDHARQWAMAFAQARS